MDDVCTACLTNGRNLHYLSYNAHHIYMQILNEIPVYNLELNIRLCWECVAVLRKFECFKTNVKKCYTELLYSLQQGTPKPLSISSLTTKPTQISNFPEELKLETDALLVDDYGDAAIKTEADNLQFDPVGFGNDDASVVDGSDAEEVTVDALKVLKPIKGKRKSRVNKKKVKKKSKNVKESDAEALDLSERDGCDTPDERAIGTEDKTGLKGTPKQLEASNFPEELKYKTDTILVDRYGDSAIKTEADNLQFDPVSFGNDDDSLADGSDDDEVLKPSKGKRKSKVNKKKVKKKSKNVKESDAEAFGLSERDGCDTPDERATGTDDKTGLKPKPGKLRQPKAVKVTRQKEAPILDEKPTCVECGKVFSSRKTYRYHLNVLHKGNNRYPCPRCGKVYQWKSNLGRHIRTHKARDSGELYCSVCDKRFASVATYKQHLRISRKHVSESEFSFTCNECGKKFVNKTRLRDHIDWEHLKKIKFRCQLCNKPFKCHTSLYVHTQNVHRDKEKKENLCHVCGKSYQNAAKLKYHIVAMHTHETPYRCAHAQCGAAFGWYSSLYRHVREVHYKMKLQPNKKGKCKKSPEDVLMPLNVAIQLPSTLTQLS